MDEIQACSEALNSLKYFFEKANEYHVAAAGSLLGIKLNRPRGLQVGKVNFLDLFPLSFSEFLKAMGKTKLRTGASISILLQSGPQQQSSPDFHGVIMTI